MRRQDECERRGHPLTPTLSPNGGRGRGKRTDVLKAHARANRRRPTDAETRLWSRLRDRRLAGWKFRRQYPIGNFVLDFYCPDVRLAVELDGGGHATEASAAYDAARSEWLSANGIQVLRFWNDQALQQTDTVLELILKALQGVKGDTPSPRPSPTTGGEGGQAVQTAKGPSPHPNPLPQRGRGRKNQETSDGH